MKTVLPGIDKVIPQASFQEAIDEAGRHGNFNPDASSARVAIQKTTTPMLILHGKDDWLVPPENALRLEKASGGRNSVVLLPGEGHVSIWFDTNGEVATRTKNWFGYWLQ